MGDGFGSTMFVHRRIVRPFVKAAGRPYPGTVFTVALSAGVDAEQWRTCPLYRGCRYQCCDWSFACPDAGPHRRLPCTATWCGKRIMQHTIGLTSGYDDITSLSRDLQRVILFCDTNVACPVWGSG